MLARKAVTRTVMAEMEERLAASYQVKHMIQQSHSQGLTQEKQKLMFKNLYLNVYSNFICNHQNMVTNQVSFKRQTDKLRYVHIIKHYNEIKKSQLLKQRVTRTNIKHLMLVTQKASCGLIGLL